jgi:hypothetical protein
MGAVAAGAAGAAGWLWAASGARGAEAGGFAFRDTPGEHLDVLLDGRTVLRHMVAFDASTAARAHATYKPYTHVFDAEGRAPITKGPGGLYTHHRGIFIGWCRIRYDGSKTNDWWHMKGVAMVHREFTERAADADRARFTARIEWVDGAGQPVVNESRTIAVHRRPAPTIALVDFESVLVPARGPMALDGDPEHAGIHFRPANEVEKKATRYVFPTEGADPRKDKDLAWAAEEFRLGEKTYGVQHMNHPANPKPTTYSAYRDYGRFGAFFKKELQAGERLAVRYRFWVLDGPLPPREKLAEQWKAFAEGTTAEARP